MQGSQIGLHAVGRQDTELCDFKNIHRISNYNFQQHSSFTKTFRYYEKIGENTPRWPFGNTINFNLNPKTMGDLLTGMWIKFEYPNTSNLFDDRASRDLKDKKYFTAPLPGLICFKEFKFTVDEQIIDVINSDSGYFNLAATDFNSQINLTPATNGDLQTYLGTTDICFPLFTSGKVYNDTRSANVIFGEGISVFTPVPFSFINNYKYNKKIKGFPLCSIYNQKICISVEFQPQEYFTNSPYNVSLPKVTLVTEEIVLGEYERHYMMKSEINIPYSVIEKQVTMDIDNVESVKSSAASITNSSTSPSSIKINLQSNIPLKAIYWYLNRKDNTYINFNPGTVETSTSNTLNTTNFLNRSHYSEKPNRWILPFNFNDLNANANTFIQYALNYPSISECSITSLENDIGFKQTTDYKTQYGSIYFRLDTYGRTNLFKPLGNFYMYNFVDDIFSQYPSGFENYTIMDKSVKHTLNINLLNYSDIKNNVYILNVFNIGFRNLYFKDGFVTVTSYS